MTPSASTRHTTLRRRHTDEGRRDSRQKPQGGSSPPRGAYRASKTGSNNTFACYSRSMAHEDRVILISYPIPLDVFGVLGDLISAAWPDSVIDSDCTTGLRIKLPSSPPEKVSEDEVQASLEARADESGLEPSIEKADIASGEASLSLKNEAWAHLAQFAAAALRLEDEEADPKQFPNGVNYVEAKMSYQEQRFVVIAAKKGRSPADLRQDAERRAEAAEAKLARYVERYGELE